MFNTKCNLPVIDNASSHDIKTIYCIQKIITSNIHDNEVYSNYVGMFDSPNGEIDNAMQQIMDEQKKWCEIDSPVRPFTLTIRKVAMQCNIDVIDKLENSFGDKNYKPLICKTCGCEINYGDDYITDAVTEETYCGTECFMEGKCKYHCSYNDPDYKDRFIL